MASQRQAQNQGSVLPGQVPLQAACLSEQVSRGRLAGVGSEGRSTGPRGRSGTCQLKNGLQGGQDRTGLNRDHLPLLVAQGSETPCPSPAAPRLLRAQTSTTIGDPGHRPLSSEEGPSWTSPEPSPFSCLNWAWGWVPRGSVAHSGHPSRDRQPQRRGLAGDSSAPCDLRTSGGFMEGGHQGWGLREGYLSSELRPPGRGWPGGAAAETGRLPPCSLCGHDAQACPHQPPPSDPRTPAEPAGRRAQRRRGWLRGASSLPAAAQNFLQKERAPGDETAWPHPWAWVPAEPPQA